MPVSVKHLVKLYLFTVSSTKRRLVARALLGLLESLETLIAGFLVKEASDRRMDQV